MKRFALLGGVHPVAIEVLARLSALPAVSIVGTATSIVTERRLASIQVATGDGPVGEQFTLKRLGASNTLINISLGPSGIIHWTASTSYNKIIIPVGKPLVMEATPGDADLWVTFVSYVGKRKDKSDISISESFNWVNDRLTVSTNVLDPRDSGLLIP